MLREGDRINNYLLEARVGAGSFGQVWRAKHHVFDETVAIKFPTDPQYVKNLQREGVTVHGLKHPNIVRAIDLDPYADPPYLVMEYIDGPSLRTLIDQYKNKFPVSAAMTIMRGILHALTIAHENNIVHRDIKPANILLQHPASELDTLTEMAVKVADFGLGHVGGETTKSMMQSGSMITQDGQNIAGTLAYMSPEQKEAVAIDGRSDLYSCGIVLFEMLTGERPQGGELPSSLRHEVPQHLDEVFRRCYTRCDRRYADTREMINALGGMQNGFQQKKPSPNGTNIKRVVPPLPGATIGSSKRCNVCDATVQCDDSYCIFCGQQLVAAVPRCQHCDGYVHSSDKFCILCGKNLTVMT